MENAGAEHDVIHGAAVNVGEREERERAVEAGIHVGGDARIGDVGADVGVREHHTFGLTGGPGGVDGQSSELAGEELVLLRRRPEVTFDAAREVGDLAFRTGGTRLWGCSRAAVVATT